MFKKQNIAAVVAELFGVVILVVSVYSMVARTSFPLFAALAAGLSLSVLVHTIGSVSGAQINPAITLGLWSIRKEKTGRALFFIAAQMLGGYAAWMLLQFFLGRDMESLAGKFEWKILIAEAVGAFVFGFGVASAVYQKYEGGKLAFTVGASLTIGILVASMGSNGVINPAVALGLQSFNWAYVVGPVIGSVFGMNLYAMLYTDEMSMPKRPVRVASKVTVKAKVAPAKTTASKKKAAPKSKKRK